jgi:TldD protein
MTPENVRDLAGGAGLFERFPKIVFLSGYTGGQVNTALGDFVFNCQALYELTPRSVTLYRPGIFRGSLLAALASISRAFGPLQLDAIGTCGKWGQSVPSSGGSHGYLFIEPSEHIGVGGA